MSEAISGTRLVPHVASLMRATVCQFTVRRIEGHFYLRRRGVLIKAARWAAATRVSLEQGGEGDPGKLARSLAALFRRKSGRSRPARQLRDELDDVEHKPFNVAYQLVHVPLCEHSSTRHRADRPRHQSCRAQNTE